MPEVKPAKLPGGGGLSGLMSRRAQKKVDQAVGAAATAEGGAAPRKESHTISGMNPFRRGTATVRTAPHTPADFTPPTPPQPALRLKLENVERPLAASDECLSFRSAHVKATAAAGKEGAQSNRGSTFRGAGTHSAGADSFAMAHAKKVTSQTLSLIHI